MKTVKNNAGTVKRVDDSTANMLVNSGSWFFCPKSEYRKTKKVKKSKDSSETVNIENRGLSDKKLRKERKLAKSKRNKN
jgi:hypothetical protein